MNSTISPLNNSFLNSTSPPFMAAGRPLLSPQAFLLLVNIFFSFIIITGVIGNSLVIVAILRWKEMSTPCNIFLLNIAVADLLLTGIGGALRITEVYYGWIFGAFLCHFLAPLQDVFVGVSGISHSTIAWERYRATVTPFKPRISKGKAKRLLPVIWILSYVSCGLPLALTTELRESKGMEYCAPNWPVIPRRIFEVFLVTVYIILQLALQTFAYLNIIRSLRSKEELGKDSTDEFTTEKERPKEIDSRIYVTNRATEKKKAKTIKILIVLVAVFQIGYIPRGTVMLISEFSKTRSLEFRYIELVSLILYYLKHVMNPFVLFLMSSEFKSALKCILLCRCKSQDLSKSCKNYGKFEMKTGYFRVEKSES